MGNGDGNNILTETSRSLRSDAKKTGLLALLLILLAGVVGRLVLAGGGRSVPAAANATMTKHEPLIGSAPSKSTPSGSQQRLAAASSSALQKWSEAPVPPISRNLFTVRIEYFPIDGSRTAQSGAEDGFWAKLQKSMDLQADQKDKRENLRSNITAQAEKLKVQSTMMGPQPRAMVNGELVGEGSVVAEFRVLKIEPRRIIVEREGIKLEIQMRN